MNWTTLQQWIMTSSRSLRKLTADQRPLRVEALEDRLTPSALHVETQPDSQKVAINSQFTLTATASSPSTTVQWEESTDSGKDFTPVTGATTDTYQFTAPATPGAIDYQAVFTNANGLTTTTKTAVVKVDVPPSVAENPGSATTIPGGIVHFTAEDTGDPTDKVHWEVSVDGGQFHTIHDATSTTLTLVAKATEDGNKYEAVFTNAVGSATTSAATLTVDSVPVITTQPSSQKVATNSQFTLTAAATGAPAETVQWEMSIDNGNTFTPVSGATTDTYQFTAPSTPGVVDYRAVFTNALGSKTTKTAVVKVDAAPSITENPASATTIPGGIVHFTAEGTGDPTDKVHWKVSVDGGQFHTIHDATSTTLTLVAKGSESGDKYEAVFTNAVGSATTSAATLTVE